MQKIGFIFPGQGAQYVGMGKTLYDEFDQVRALYSQANELLGFDIAKLCFEGPADELTSTRNSQPAILITSIAALTAFREKRGRNIAPSACAGLSLGEYSALVAADVMSFEDAVRLVRLRGQAMEDASKENPGKMLCIIGLEPSVVEGVCSESSAEIANLNCPGQVVVSGTAVAIEKAALLAKDKGAKRCIPLDVSGPFHSSLMKPAAERLEKALDGMELKKPAVPFIGNVTASFEDDVAVIKSNLALQVNNRTRWEASVREMAKAGITEFYEIGPGNVLKGLLRRIDKALTVHNIDKAPDLASS